MVLADQSETAPDTISSTTSAPIAVNNFLPIVQVDFISGFSTCHDLMSTRRAPGVEPIASPAYRWPAGVAVLPASRDRFREDTDLPTLELVVGADDLERPRSTGVTHDPLPFSALLMTSSDVVEDGGPSMRSAAGRPAARATAADNGVHQVVDVHAERLFGRFARGLDRATNSWPITTSSGVCTCSTAYSTLASTDLSSTSPAARTTNRSPRPTLKTSSGRHARVGARQDGGKRRLPLAQLCAAMVTDGLGAGGVGDKACVARLERGERRSRIAAHTRTGSSTSTLVTTIPTRVRFMRSPAICTGFIGVKGKTGPIREEWPTGTDRVCLEGCSRGGDRTSRRLADTRSRSIDIPTRSAGRQARARGPESDVGRVLLDEAQAGLKGPSDM